MEELEVEVHRQGKEEEARVVAEGSQPGLLGSMECAKSQLLAASTQIGRRWGEACLGVALHGRLDRGSRGSSEGGEEWGPVPGQDAHAAAGTHPELSLVPRLGELACNSAMR